MNQEQATLEYEKLGQEWLKGARITEWTFPNGKTMKLLPSQIKFLNSKSRYCLFSGGFACGKSFILLMEIIFLCLFFPNSSILLGRKTRMDLDRTTLPELFTLIGQFIPSDWVRHKVKEGIIEFWNGSIIILFGLDALQGEGSQQDIKKAQQKIKSLNLSAVFLEQLEEIEENVFEALTARLRKADVPIRLFRATTNPANFWGYRFFIVNPKKRKDLEVIQGSMLENKENLPKDYLEDQLSKDKNYVERFVKGKWDMSILLQSTIFGDEQIRRLEKKVRPPITKEEGFEIYEQPNPLLKYYAGCDSSEGVIDPSSISVVSEEGHKVAKFNDFITISGLVEKLRFIYQKYYTNRKPLIVLEANACGTAVLELTKDLNHYKRKVWDIRQKRETEKLGFKTSAQTKTTLISHFQDLMRHQDFFPQIYDKNTIEEMKTFIWTDSARELGAGAEKNFHDDDVMSTLLGFLEIKGKPTMSFEQIQKIKRQRNQVLEAKEKRKRSRNDYR